jgi:tight adherence protein C
MMLWITLSFMLIGLAAVVYLLAQKSTTDPETEKRFNEALDADQDEGWLNQRRWRTANSLTARIKRLLEKTPGADMQEVESLLRQAAMSSDRSRSLVYASLWATPAATTGLAIMLAAAYHHSAMQFAVFGLGIGFIAPRKMLRWAAERRKAIIREEMPVVLNLMRLLFDAGLSLEHTLKAISEQGKQIAPNLANEFAWVLVRIHHGQDRGAALEEMSQRVDVPELSETVAILKQAARYGGSLRESLLRYLRLMEDRRLTDLRDKVGKLSAKMTIVMVAFMFPALMIFLAGPGFMSIGTALSSVH